MFCILSFFKYKIYEEVDHTPLEEIGKNTAKYTISASCDLSSLETEEVKPVDPAWIYVCSGITFIHPKNVQPEPPSPGDPNVSALTGTNSWTTKVSAPYAGQWKLKFTATVTYYVWDKKKEEYVLNEDGTKATFGPYSGSGTCNFIATSKPWKVELSTESIVVRRATNPQQKIVPFKKVTAKLVDADNAKTVTISNNGVGEVRFGTSEPLRTIFSGPKGEAANDNNEDWRDSNPPIIYDIDGSGGVRPRTNLDGSPRNSSMAGVFNFREFAIFNDVRCSDVLEFYVEMLYKSSTDQLKSTLFNGYKASIFPNAGQ